MIVGAEQQAFWSRNGYLWLRGFLGADETAALASWTDELASWPDTPGRWMRYYEKTPDGGKTPARLENFLPFHAGLDRLFRGKLDAVVTALVGAPVVVFKDKINLKSAGGAGFTPHQDAPAYADFGVPFHATVMVPIDRFTADNGCLEMAVDATQTAVLPQNPDGTLRPEQVERFQWTPILAAPGDVIVFDSYVPHRSGPNRSAGPRRSYYVTYNRAADGDHRQAYYDKKRALFPQECERQPGVDYAALGAQFNLANPFE